jgi:hypothetical protein
VNRGALQQQSATAERMNSAARRAADWMSQRSAEHHRVFAGDLSWAIAWRRFSTRAAPRVFIIGCRLVRGFFSRWIATSLEGPLRGHSCFFKRTERDAGSRSKLKLTVRCLFGGMLERVEGLIQCIYLSDCP